LKLEHNEPLSNFAAKSNLRPYSMVGPVGGHAAAAARGATCITPAHAATAVPVRACPTPACGNAGDFNAADSKAPPNMPDFPSGILGNSIIPEYSGNLGQFLRNL
jgi:hypothetical protein